MWPDTTFSCPQVCDICEWIDMCVYIYVYVHRERERERERKRETTHTHQHTHRWMDEARLQLDCQSEQITEATQRIKALEEHKNALLHKTTALETLANDRHTSPLPRCCGHKKGNTTNSQDLRSRDPR
jgi:hypothetical protein